MKDKILALLVAKFAGVRKDGLAQLAAMLSLQIEKEEEVTAIIDKLTPEKVDSFIKDWRKDVDKEVSESNKTFEGNLKKKYDFVEKKEPDPNPNPNPKQESGKDDIATIVANAVKAAVEPFQQKLSAFEGSKIKETRLQTLQGKLKDTPKTYSDKIISDFNRMNFESDDSFNEYLSETEKNISDFTQELADSKLSTGGRPYVSTSTEKESPAVQAYIQAKTADNLDGKKI